MTSASKQVSGASAGPSKTEEVPALPQTPSVSVIIVNYNTGKLLLASVKSVLSTHPTANCVVVDNASTDDSVALLEKRFKKHRDRLKIVRREANTGFAAACNIGIGYCDADYILFLNPDCILYENTIQRLSAHLATHPNVAIAGPMILNADGTEQNGCRRDIPSPFQVSCILFGIHRLMPNHPRFRHFNLSTMPLPQSPISVQAVSGACMMVPRRHLETLGGFDTKFFLHFEDLDLCYRTHLSHKIIAFIPDATATHIKGVSSQSLPVKVAWHKHYSFIKFMKKHFFTYYPSFFLFLIFSLIILRFLVSLPGIVLLGKSKRSVDSWDKMIENPYSPTDQASHVSQGANVRD